MNKKENDLVNGSFQSTSDLPRMNHVDEMLPEEDGEMEDELDDGEKSNESKFCWIRFRFHSFHIHDLVSNSGYMLYSLFFNIVVVFGIYGRYTPLVCKPHANRKDRE